MGKIKDFGLLLWKLSPQSIYHMFKRNDGSFAISRELYRISHIPRYKNEKTKILGNEISMVDSASFLFLYNEIFEKEIYKFPSGSKKPKILDCGANIGLSVIYFKKLFPDARITAFEPDPLIFKILKNNIDSFNFNDVELIQKGLSNNEGECFFHQEGADSGKIINENYDCNSKIKIKTTRLKNYLSEPIDLLKIDIEGMETEVIADSKDLLYNVKYIFVEYHSFRNQKQTLHILIGILADAGFRLHLYPPSVNSSQPFINLKTSNNLNDMQLNIFGFRD
ncbi:MAG: FkbM family methyltransferase [Bacteroidales bacterium]|nr:FkbM family methyltransferase [Bacteroidales bacterium]